MNTRTDSKFIRDDVSNLLIKIKEQSKKLNEQLESFSADIISTEQNIVERNEAIKRMVDQQTRELLENLNLQKSNALKAFHTTDEELQRSVMICDSFVSYCQKAIDEADEVQIVRIADELKTRAEEIKSMEVPELSVFPRVEFIPSGINTSTDPINFLGTILGE